MEATWWKVGEKAAGFANSLLSGQLTETRHFPDVSAPKTVLRFLAREGRRWQVSRASRNLR